MACNLRFHEIQYYEMPIIISIILGTEDTLVNSLPS